MPLSELDPSMLIGFLCKNEADWIDLRQRVTDVCALFFICPCADWYFSYLVIMR